jgi:hypothetical protein
MGNKPETLQKMDLRLKAFFASSTTVEQRSDGGGVFQRLKTFIAAAGLAVAAFSGDALASTSTNASTPQWPIVKISSPDVVDVYSDVAAAGFSGKISVIEEDKIDSKTMGLIASAVLENSFMTRASLEATVKEDKDIAVSVRGRDRLDPLYKCAVFVSPANASSLLSGMSGLHQDRLPDVDHSFLRRFTASHEIGHCIAGAEPLDFQFQSFFNSTFWNEARAANNTRRDEMRADAFAVFREIQRGTPQTSLALIADARLAKVSYAMSVRHLAHDTGEMLTEIVSNYEALRTDPKFMSASVSEIVDMARDMADKYHMDDEAFMRRAAPIAELEGTQDIPLRYMSNARKNKVFSKSPLLALSIGAISRLEAAGPPPFFEPTKKLEQVGVRIVEAPQPLVRYSAIDAWLESQIKGKADLVSEVDRVPGYDP